MKHGRILIRVAGVVLLGGLVAACALPREPSYTDRCAALMKEAFPGGDIAVTDAHAALSHQAASLATMTAEVAGTRRNVAAGGFVSPEVAVECRFDNGVLTDFHWTKGPFR